MVKTKEDLTGKTFGRLLVLKQEEDYVLKRGEHVAQWLCRCSCDNKSLIIVSGHNLRRGNTKSCGCLHKEKTKSSRHKINKYDISGSYGIGWTTNTNREFYFELSDYDKIKDLCWIETFDNGVSRLSAYDPNTKKNVRMHVLLGYKNCDHIDKNEFNNLRSNIRECSHQQNDFNRGLYKNNKSGVTGVSWIEKSQRWIARIMVNGKNIHIGSFLNKEDAIVARLKAELEYFKEFAPQRNLIKKYLNV